MGKITWRVMAMAFAIPAGYAAEKAIEAGWRAVRKSDPPRNPEAPGTSWGEALAWAAVSGLAVAGAKLVAARGAAVAYRRLTGELPPGLEDVATT